MTDWSKPLFVASCSTASARRPQGPSNAPRCFLHGQKTTVPSATGISGGSNAGWAVGVIWPEHGPSFFHRGLATVFNRKIDWNQAEGSWLESVGQWTFEVVSWLLTRYMSWHERALILLAKLDSCCEIDETFLLRSVWGQLIFPFNIYGMKNEADRGSLLWGFTVAMILRGILTNHYFSYLRNWWFHDGEKPLEMIHVSPFCMN